MLVPMGFCVCSDVCVCVWGSVCVVVGLNRLIGVSWVCVWICVLNRCQRLREKERKKKKRLLESLRKQKFRLEKNNKERLKNNILIKIEFWDVGGIVKWDGIMIKWFFGMVK